MNDKVQSFVINFCHPERPPKQNQGRIYLVYLNIFKMKNFYAQFEFIAFCIELMQTKEEAGYVPKVAKKLYMLRFIQRIMKERT